MRGLVADVRRTPRPDQDARGRHCRQRTVWATTLAVVAWYTTKLSVNTAGALSATVGGTLLASYTPTTAVTSGYVGAATESSEAAFDNVS